MDEQSNELKLGTVPTGTCVIIEARVVCLTKEGRLRLRLADGTEFWADEAGLLRVSSQLTVSAALFEVER